MMVKSPAPAPGPPRDWLCRVGWTKPE